MTTLQKITKSKDPVLFTMYREGIFYKCYNEDAMLFYRHIKAYQVSAKQCIVDAFRIAGGIAA